MWLCKCDDSGPTRAPFATPAADSNWSKWFHVASLLTAGDKSLQLASRSSCSMKEVSIFENRESFADEAESHEWRKSQCISAL